MGTFQLFAQPWWVNTAVLIPFLLYGIWRKFGGLAIAKRQLFWALLFAVAFGYLESAVVIYIRASIGLLPGYEGTLADVQRLTADYYQVAQIPAAIPQSLAVVEILREAATMVMLATAAVLAHARTKERTALFFWMAAAWDIAYYGFLWLLIRWPVSLASPDILFLMPVPWISQVWFPVLVSVLTMLAIFLARDTGRSTAG